MDGEEDRSTRRKTLEAERERTNKLNSHLAPGPGIHRGHLQISRDVMEYSHDVISFLNAALLLLLGRIVSMVGQIDILSKQKE